MFTLYFSCPIRSSYGYALFVRDIAVLCIELHGHFYITAVVQRTQHVIFAWLLIDFKDVLTALFVLFGQPIAAKYVNGIVWAGVAPILFCSVSQHLRRFLVRYRNTHLDVHATMQVYVFLFVTLNSVTLWSIHSWNHPVVQRHSAVYEFEWFCRRP